VSTSPASTQLTPTIAVSDIPDRFFIDIAVGVHTFEDLCAAHNLSPEAVTALTEDPRFQQRAALAKQAVEDDGRAFRARCRTIVNDSVLHMVQLMKDPETPPSTQLETFKTLVKFGNLEPETNKSADNGPQLVFTIVAPDGAQITMGSTDQGPRTSPPPPRRVEKNVTPPPEDLADAEFIGADALGF
jgi:hypothetical protein